MNRMRHLIDIGAKFGGLIVIGSAGSGRRGASFICRCACGRLTQYDASTLVRSNHCGPCDIERRAKRVDPVASDAMVRLFLEHTVLRPNADDCWLWSGRKNQNGYGRFRSLPDGIDMQAHRAAWLIANGPIPSGMLIMHLCDVHACVNPRHLVIGNPGANMFDALKKGRLRNHITGKAA